MYAHRAVIPCRRKFIFQAAFDRNSAAGPEDRLRAGILRAVIAYRVHIQYPCEKEIGILPRLARDVLLKGKMCGGKCR